MKHCNCEMIKHRSHSEFIITRSDATWCTRFLDFWLSGSSCSQCSLSVVSSAFWTKCTSATSKASRGKPAHAECSPKQNEAYSNRCEQQQQHTKQVIVLQSSRLSGTTEGWREELKQGEYTDCRAYVKMAHTVLPCGMKTLAKIHITSSKKETKWKECDVPSLSEQSSSFQLFSSICSACCGRLGNYSAASGACKWSRTVWVMQLPYMHTHPDWLRRFSHRKSGWTQHIRQWLSVCVCRY